MLDIDKDIEVEIEIRRQGKVRGYAHLIIGGLIKINNFEITQADNGKIYVVNPHMISYVYNKVELKKEIRYVSNASLLENENRKKIVDKIVEAFAEELDKVKKGTEKALVSTRKVTNYTRHEIQINEEDIKGEKEKYGEDVFSNQSDDSTVRTIR